MSEICCICGKTLPNRWSVGKRETVGGIERCYCPLHANDTFNNKKISKETSMKGGSMEENKITAWSECSALAGKLGGGVKALWSKIHPDHSPEAMLSVLNENLAGNKSRLSEMKPELDGVYREIVAKKKDYQGAPPARQRILKVELQTLMARYKSLEREFSILSENARSIEQVKGRFLEVLAYGKRGKLDVGMVDRLSDDIDDKADMAEDIQDALGDLERAGKRTDRTADDFENELAAFDGELGIYDKDTNTTQKETENEQDETDDTDAAGGHFAERAGDMA